MGEGMRYLRNFLKIFGKDDHFPAALRPDMSEDELIDAVRGMAVKFVRFSHDHAIGFYRAIGSHDFGAYPRVWEEFFFLTLFVSGWRLKNIFCSDRADRAISFLHDELDSFLTRHEANFNSRPFWGLYAQRAEFYQSRLKQGSGMATFEKIVPAFSSNVVSKLDDWPALVSHHAAVAASAVLTELLAADS